MDREKVHWQHLKNRSSVIRTFDSRLKKFFFLIETGVDLEFSLNEKLSVLLNGSYFASLSDPVSNEFVSYQINDGPVQSVKSIVLGDYFNLGVGMKYRFGKIKKEGSIKENPE